MAPPGITRRADGDFTVHEKEDGTDYWRIVKACIDENIDQDAFIRDRSAPPDIAIERDGVSAVLHPLTFKNPKRMVFRLEWEGRVFILKRAFMGTIGLRRLFPNSMGMTYFTRIMRKVDAAVRAGCVSTQGYFCVAERWRSALRQEVWLLLEYIEGRMLSGLDMELKKDLIVAAVEDLLRHSLAMDDFARGNFLIGADKRSDRNGEIVRAIDISCRPLTSLQAAKMRMKLNKLHGLGLPLRGRKERFFGQLLGARYWVREMLGLGGIEE